MGISQLEKIASTTCVCMVLAAFGATPAKADILPWYDDPNSTIFADPTTTSGNTVTQVVGVTNTGSAHDIGLLFPLLELDINNVFGNLVWNQADGGWAGTSGGISLVVTITSPTLGLLPWSEVADPTGTAQEEISMFGQTTDPADSYPFVNFGVLAPGASASATFDYNFNWGPGGSGVPHFENELESVAPNPNAVPEPGSVILLATLALTLGFVARKRIAQM
jgi:hypothetical protein